MDLKKVFKLSFGYSFITLGFFFLLPFVIYGITFLFGLIITFMSGKPDNLISSLISSIFWLLLGWGSYNLGNKILK